MTGIIILLITGLICVGLVFVTRYNNTDNKTGAELAGGSLFVIMIIALSLCLGTCIEQEQESKLKARKIKQEQKSKINENIWE